MDKKLIKSFPTTCKEKISAKADNPAVGITAEADVPDINIFLITICRLIVAFQAANYYNFIGRTMNSTNIHYSNILSRFKIEWDTYEEFNKYYDPDVPVITDKDNDRKVIKWVSIFPVCISQTYGSRGNWSM